MNHTIDDKVRDRQMDIEAAKQVTAPLLKKGWMTVFGGWALGLVPVLGILGWIVAFVGGVAIGIVAITRGNTSGGVVLAAVAWLGTAVVGCIEVFLWAILGFGGLSILGGL